MEKQNERESNTSVRMKKLDVLLNQTSLYSTFLEKKIKTTPKRSHFKPSNPTCPSKSRSKKKQKLSAKKNAEIEEEVAANVSQLLSGPELREYQKEGVDWLISLYENGLNGILADEMGLGKTVQVIALVTYLRSNRVSPFLIVAPLSTLPNWMQEFKRWAPDVKTQCYYGSKSERAEMRHEWTHFNGGSVGAENEEKLSVIITSYEVAMRDSRMMSGQPWKHLIVDEGHRLKNMNCKLIRLLKGFNSENRLLLTGTPLQNNLGELWSLLNFLLPLVFDDLQKFESWFEFDVDSDQGQSQIIDAEKSNQIVSKLHHILRPFVLRRLKKDVLTCLPAKREYILYTEMTQLQKRYYKAILNKELHGKSKVSLNNLLMQLRKVCNHPFLLSQDPAIDDNLLVSTCGKMQVLDSIINKLLAAGRKVLLFSQMTRMLDVIEDYFSSKGLHDRICRIDGSVPSLDRQARIDKFNNDPKMFCFLLSTRAGGLGINLTSADTVVIYDSDWNPHQDAQAQDRCHRIGQSEEVVVLRLMTKDSVEISVLQKAMSKKKLEHLVIDQGDLRGKKSIRRNGITAGSTREKVIQSIVSLFEHSTSETPQEEAKDEKKASPRSSRSKTFKRSSREEEKKKGHAEKTEKNEEEEEEEIVPVFRRTRSARRKEKYLAKQITGKKRSREHTEEEEQANQDAAMDVSEPGNVLHSVGQTTDVSWGLGEEKYKGKYNVSSLNLSREQVAQLRLKPTYNVPFISADDLKSILERNPLQTDGKDIGNNSVNNQGGALSPLECVPMITGDHFEQVVIDSSYSDLF